MNANEKTAPGTNRARTEQASKDAYKAARIATVKAEVKAACAARLEAFLAA